MLELSIIPYHHGEKRDHSIGIFRVAESGDDFTKFSTSSQ
ncbi:hypothetical protein RintRC_0772 [Richelia intracellularis]|nr:hypothetical protein RintRC_0772 [Richelia intracellularis]